jgi:hypothetical protein
MVSTHSSNPPTTDTGTLVSRWIPTLPNWVKFFMSIKHPIVRILQQTCESVKQEVGEANRLPPWGTRSGRRRASTTRFTSENGRRAVSFFKVTALPAIRPLRYRGSEHGYFCVERVHPADIVRLHRVIKSQNDKRLNPPEWTTTLSLHNTLKAEKCQRLFLLMLAHFHTSNTVMRDRQMTIN